MNDLAIGEASSAWKARFLLFKDHFVNLSSKSTCGEDNIPQLHWGVTKPITSLELFIIKMPNTIWWKFIVISRYKNTISWGC